MDIETIANLYSLMMTLLGLLSSLFRHIENPRKEWLYIIGFFLTNLLSEYYWTVFTLVMGYNPDISALMAYFGWNASYIFLLIAVLIMRKPEEKKFFHPLMLLPIPINIFQFILYIPFGGIFNSLWQVVFTTIISVYCLQSIIYYLKNRKNGVFFPAFHTLSLFYLMTQYGMWTSSCFDWPRPTLDPYYYFAYINFGSLIFFTYAMWHDLKAGGYKPADKSTVDIRFKMFIRIAVSVLLLFGCFGGYYMTIWMKKALVASGETTEANRVIAIILFIMSIFLVALILSIVALITVRHKVIENESVQTPSEKRRRFNFIFTLLITFAMMVFVVIYTSRLFYKISVTNIYASGQDKASSVANELDTYLSTAKSVLWSTADTIDFMIQKGESSENIRDFIVTQTNNQREQFDENFTGLYGYINKEYMDGTAWIPPEGYDPEQRDWYKLGISAGGETVIVPPYLDAQTQSIVITICKMVSDKKSVVGLDVIVNHIQELTDSININGKGYGFIINSSGMIISHPDQEQNGKTADEVLGPGILDRIIEQDEGLLTLPINEEDHVMFIKKVMDQWYVVVTVSNTELFDDVRSQLQINIIFYLIIFALILFFYYVSYKNEQSYSIKMQEMAAARQKQEYEAQVLKLEKASADEANKAKSNFLADMSHEIRTPINAILGMNEMILRETDNSTISDYSNNIKTSGKKLLELVNSILDFSKIEDGKMEIVPVRYSTASMITYLVNSISGRASGKNLQLSLDIDPSLPSELYGDESRISQAVMNLLTNAVKYTETGTVTFTMKALDKSDKTARIYVEVKDTGIGIKEEDMGRLFESFERLDVVRNRTIEGTGLGMSITTKLLNLMNSELKVDSVYGEGSTFSFEIEQGIEDLTPLGEYTSNISGNDNSYNYEALFTAPSAHILIVDDTQMNLLVATSLLKKTLIKIDTASSGQEAIDLSKEISYDVILMDQRMPGMDGTQALNGIKAIENSPNAETPVICLTADALRGAREKYLSLGFQDYLTKPIEGRALENMLITYLPAEKIQNGEHSADNTLGDEQNTAPAQDILQNEPSGSEKSLYKALEDIGIDTKKGLSYCMQDDETYKLVLNEYASSSPVNREKLASFLADKNWNDYSIVIHAIKSSSKSIGASDLFKKSEKLQNAADSGDGDYVEKEHAAAMEIYEKISSVITENL
ncbi:MAG: response regulator [Lachnospiraceae bacterium]|nr:response regulator [Lachnospiraceae bacterium]